MAAWLASVLAWSVLSEGIHIRIRRSEDRPLGNGLSNLSHRLAQFAGVFQHFESGFDVLKHLIVLFLNDLFAVLFLDPLILSFHFDRIGAGFSLALIFDRLGLGTVLL